MGTRGAYGFIKNGQMKVSYNHWDSYLEYLGENMVEFIRTTPIIKMNKICDRIELVKHNEKPTKSQFLIINHFLRKNKLHNDYNPSNFGNGKKDWYYWLNPCQGKPNLFKLGLKYMTDDKNFMDDSLFCEFAYLIDLDRDKFLIKSNERTVEYDLDKIPINWIELTYPQLENNCKDKYFSLMYEKTAEEQRNTIEQLGFLDFIKSDYKQFDYYALEQNYNDILENMEEKELENVLDSYLEKQMEII